jgi:hypothetical protein
MTQRSVSGFLIFVTSSALIIGIIRGVLQMWGT